jgi:hypothetical protein
MRVAFILLIVCHPVSSVIAREPVRIHISQDGDIVGGEPGEDPHLRLQDLERIIYEEPVGTVTDIGERDLYPIETFGGECFDEDSRVRDAWKVIFYTLYDVLLR